MPSLPLSTLVEIIDSLSVERSNGALAVASLASDSRQVTQGALFVAVTGTHVDGRKYVEDAVLRGAVAVVVDRDAALPALPAHVAVLRTNDVRLTLAKLAAFFSGAQPTFVAAVTGTDGKTSTAHFARELLHLSGFKSASIGTLGMIDEKGVLLEAGTHTTPDPITLHETLTRLKAKGFEHVVMEASSHGLDQRRLDGVNVSAAAFTNLSRDHLDYHKDLDTYFSAKARLFLSVLRAEGLGVVNAEDQHKDVLINMLTKRGCRTLQYGAHVEAELRIDAIHPEATGQHVHLTLCGHEYELHVPLVGNFQIYNMLAALGLVSEAGLPIADLVALLPKLSPVPGRLQRVGSQVVVDYAHTPGALSKALATLRLHTEGKLHVVFGCGGDRDAGKRPEMGAVAAQLADTIIVTDDNPRSEEPAAIRKAVLAMCPGAKEIGDRREAIAYALKQLRPGDVLLIAGKGHETEQIIGTTRHHFSDVEVVQEEMRK